MQDAELLAKHAPDNKQRFDQDGQIRKVLDQLLDPRLELNRAPSVPSALEEEAS
jgi:hypothetical protein